MALYLPPYSPDRNPMEKMWSKAKAILCCCKIRSVRREASRNCRSRLQVG
ncbi:MAG: hypothetical protein HFF89_08555 [Oscillibacter sp.]|nr:hypothetical protein [Oscillibacter sp.]